MVAGAVGADEVDAEPAGQGADLDRCGGVLDDGVGRRPGMVATALTSCRHVVHVAVAHVTVAVGRRRRSGYRWARRRRGGGSGVCLAAGFRRRRRRETSVGGSGGGGGPGAVASCAETLPGPRRLISIRARMIAIVDLNRFLWNIRLSFSTYIAED